MTRSELIDAVMGEMERVWGEAGFEGTVTEYHWLFAHYGITEEEDVQWQLVLEHNMGELSSET